MRPFDDFVRTLIGRSDKFNKSEYGYFNCYATPRAALGDLYKRWFVEYSSDASRIHINDPYRRYHHSLLRPRIAHIPPSPMDAERENGYNLPHVAPV